MKYVFGPVPSRRLGFSLGVDLIPFKTCSLDCTYCQLGKTPHKTLERKAYNPLDNTLEELREALKHQQKIDYITIAGSGEPTLSTQLGAVISGIKEMSEIPVAVLTNGSLLHCEDVRRELLQADVVIPSLDTVSQEIFTKVNRPHPELSVSQMIAGLDGFRKVFQGKLWLEIMLVRGINDSFEELESMRDVLSTIKLDMIQINTPVRPGTDRTCKPLTSQELACCKEILGEPSEMIASFDGRQHTLEANLTEKICSMVSRRPLNLSEIADSLGMDRDQATEVLSLLEEQGKVVLHKHGVECYYQVKRS
jgi:wyosine [tRNA(Phe)-imidazoG37] synthetase (radical SAM superfamily)